MPDPSWSFEGNRRAQALDALRLSHAERLAWLEGMKAFCAIALGAARRPRENRRDSAAEGRAESR